MNNPRKYRRRFGDRPDGRRLRTIDPLFSGRPYNEEEGRRCELLFGTLNVAEAESIYVKRCENMRPWAAAFLLRRCADCFKKPAINRFVSGRKLYARTEISVNLTVKKSSPSRQETTVKMYFEPTDTIDIVIRRFKRRSRRQSRRDSNKTDRMARLLNYVPDLF